MAGLPTLPFFFGVMATTHLPFAGILIVHIALPALTVHEPRTVFAALATVVALIEYVVAGAAVKLAVVGRPTTGGDHCTFTGVVTVTFTVTLFKMLMVGLGAAPLPPPLGGVLAGASTKKTVTSRA